ncbi:tRNA pseudouridine synthase A, mitochondrial [Strongyloides ratti]|uniref:Pseudouridylate synthase 1 homolog n=1 Tax=Strongyloides ratti TaxID=34506 RepID=A0A090N0E4_STRRB|nr:tRNA pseudouridine synthase A, mitochondrial [Strongyloides ratti]CEF70542.1 tRNA pseudouridine synthase A, mitochondrial [Strongyloides ratti]
MPSHLNKNSKNENNLHKVISGKVEKPSIETNEIVKVIEQQKDRKPVVRKYAMLLAYQGKNYFGMQIQKDQCTIEQKIFEGLYKCGFITEQQKNDPYSFYFQRAARTDKAVSAVKQTCSMFLPRDHNVQVDGHVKMNEHMPSDIKILGFRLATKSFHSQKDCSSRTYSYTVPSYTFAPLNELTNDNYRITEERIKEIDEILSIYKGTHNFYNYTSKRDSGDKSCWRYIINFYTGKPFIYKDSLHEKDHEFITLYIQGQSFMLHQIRKMVGMVIAVLRGFTFKSEIQRSFETERMDIPKAPGLGLVLEKVHYTSYDKKWKNSHPTLDDWGEEIEQEVEKLKTTLVYKEILDTECFKFNMMQWLSDMDKHTFSTDPTLECTVDKDLTGIQKARILLEGNSETIKDPINSEKVETNAC